MVINWRKMKSGHKLVINPVYKVIDFACDISPVHLNFASILDDHNSISESRVDIFPNDE